VYSTEVSFQAGPDDSLLISEKRFHYWKVSRADANWPAIIFGKYVFSKFGRSFFLLRTTNGLWLKTFGPDPNDSDNPMDERADLGLTGGWRDAAVLSIERIQKSGDKVDAPEGRITPVYCCLFRHRLGPAGVLDSRPVLEFFGKDQRQDLHVPEKGAEEFGMEGGIYTLPSFWTNDGGRPALINEVEDQAPLQERPISWSLPVSFAPPPMRRPGKDKREYEAELAAFLLAVQEAAKKAEELAALRKSLEQLMPRLAGLVGAFSFPTHPQGNMMLNLDDAERKALQDFKDRFDSRVRYDAIDEIEFATLRQSDVKHAAATFRHEGRMSAAHETIESYLGFYNSVSEEVDGYIGSAVDYIQSSFFLQEAEVSDIARQLGVVSLVPSSEQTVETAISAIGIITNAMNVVGATVAPVAVFSAILCTATAVYDQVRDEPEPGPTGNAAVAVESAQFLDVIREDFFRQSYALDALRQRICASTAALEAWKELRPTWFANTELLERSTTEVFRQTVWQRLLPAACVIECKCYHGGSEGSSITPLDNKQRDLKARLKEKRAADPTVLALEERTKLHLLPSGSTTEYTFWAYRLRLTGGDMPKETFYRMCEATGIGAFSLMHHSSIRTKYVKKEFFGEYSDYSRGKIVYG